VVNVKPIAPVVPGLDLPVVTFAEDQPEYLPLPAWRDANGTVVTRWRLSLKERIRVLFTGDLWLTLMTFNHPLQPVKLTTDCPIKGLFDELS
jgi:hypothetical protein